jgi:hypothetical protein
MVNVGLGLNTVYAWYTTKITDKNGNYANIGYAADNSPEITGVTTSDNRAISFAYITASPSMTRRISSISAAGQTYEYAYQEISGTAGSFQLIKVTRPDGTTWQYSYNGNLNTCCGNDFPGSHLMKVTTHPEGGTINYGYGYVHFDNSSNPNTRTTVIKSKVRSSGSGSAGGTWSFDYVPGQLGAYDTTTVITPSGTEIYRHIGPSYSNIGTVWMVGLLASKKIGNVQTETYTWDKQKISSEDNARTGAFSTKFDYDTFAPILAQKRIDRDGASYTTTYRNLTATATQVW